MGLGFPGSYYVAKISLYNFCVCISHTLFLRAVWHFIVGLHLHLFRYCEWMSIWVISRLLLLWLLLPRRFLDVLSAVHKSEFPLISTLEWNFWVIEYLSECSDSQDNAILPSKVVVPIYIPTSSTQETSFIHILSKHLVFIRLLCFG